MLNLKITVGSTVDSSTEDSNLVAIAGEASIRWRVVLEVEEDEELDEEEDEEFEKWEREFQKLSFHQNGPQIVVAENESLKVKSFVGGGGGGDDRCCLSFVCCLQIFSFI